ncbi:MAG TPA: hypothetical protein VFS60_18270 [Thermoanaerobaculia bacterium]|nr:hypothetical protein [Thermoanaerobaculia bacterium]
MLRHLVIAVLPAAVLTASPSLAADPFATRAADPRPPHTFDLGRPPLDALNAQSQEWRHLRALVGPGDLRRLDAVYVRFNLQSQFWTDPERDPFYDRTRDTVRSGYMKMYREILQRQYPVDELVDDALAAIAARRAHPGRAGGAAGDHNSSTWRLKVSPRVAVGSSGYLGVRLSLPDTGIDRLDHLQLNLRHGVFEQEWAVGLRYAHGPRFLQLERVVGDPKSGERYTATVALRF